VNNRNTDYPSLSPEILYHINKYDNTYNITTRIKLIIIDILQEFENNPHTKLIIFSQYPESLESAMKMFINYNTINKQKMENDPESKTEDFDSNLLYDVFSCVIVGGKESTADREENLRYVYVCV
jgi:hypothetical protein